MNSSNPADRTLNLRAGEWVEVRSAEEILATLDQTQALDGLPFMAEMLQYCGRRFRVYKSAHKTCDTIQTYVIRRMSTAVHLEEARCDGSAHGGCQAGCLIFWKEAWLKRTTSGDSARAPEQARSAGARERASSLTVDVEPLRRATLVEDVSELGETRYRCQATDVIKATSPVRRRERWDPRFYVKDLTSGNVRLAEFVWFALRAAFNAFTLRWFGWRYPRICGLANHETPTGNLNLRPGEAVQVRSKGEITRTLTPQLKNRGLWFDVEMVPYCESTFRVLKRVERIIDEKTGRMITLRNPCLVLEGATCSGRHSHNRMFCPRGIYPYWREVWLKRVSSDDDSAR